MCIRDSPRHTQKQNHQQGPIDPTDPGPSETHDNQAEALHHCRHPENQDITRKTQTPATHQPAPQARTYRPYRARTQGKTRQPSRSIAQLPKPRNSSCSNMFQYVPICSSMFQYVPVCSNLAEMIPMCVVPRPSGCWSSSKATHNTTHKTWKGRQQAASQ